MQRLTAARHTALLLAKKGSDYDQEFSRAYATDTQSVMRCAESMVPQSGIQQLTSAAGELFIILFAGMRTVGVCQRGIEGCRAC